MNSGELDGWITSRLSTRSATRFESEGARARGSISCATGRQPPRYWGCPSGDLLRRVRAVPVPRGSCLCPCRDVATRSPTRQRAIADQATRRAQTNARIAGAASARTDTFDPQGRLLLRATPRRTRPTGDERADTGRRWTSTSAASNTRSCICCISASTTSCCATRAW